MPNLSTPVLQSQSTALAGLRSSPVALITPSKKKGIFYRSSRNEQQLETSLLSLNAAEEALHDSESGSVIAFVHIEPCQNRGSSTGSRRHHLYVSFKYRTSLIHYAYYHVHLKANGREARRAIFHAEKKEHFDTVCELFNTFIPTLRTWLGAIVKAANFIDQPVESVDLKNELRSRHHLILTRRTTVAASVVLCKLDPETKKIVSTSIVFDFKTQRIRDDSGNSLRSFHEVFQQFLGLHHGNPLMPSPREEDEEEPRALGLLEGLEVDASPKKKLRTLLGLQSKLKGPEPEPEFLELMATFLLPQLMDTARHSGISGGHAGSTTSDTPAGTAGSSGPSMGSGTSESSAGAIGSGGRGLPGELALEAPFDEIQVLICDILADICDLRVESVGTNVWRMCKEYLEDPGNWYACLATLAMLTLMSRRLAAWLVQHTDAAVRLVSVFIESHQMLVSQHEVAISAAGRAAPQSLPPRPNQSRSGDNMTGGPRFLGRCAELGPVAPIASSQHDPSRRGSNSSNGDLEGDSSTHNSRWADLGMRREKTTGSLPSFSPSSVISNRSARRAPSFDNFEDTNLCHPGVDEHGYGMGTGAAIGDLGGVHGSLGRRPGDMISHEDGGSAASQASAGSAEARNARPVRVPPLNLDLASRLPSSGTTSVLPPEGTTSMTRSSRRLRLRMREGPLHPQPNPNPMGTSSRSATSSRLSSGTHSHSMPSIGLRFMSSCLPSYATSPNSSASVLCTQVEMQSQQQAIELAKALGEACLLADLSHLLKYKQERQVQEAVMDRVGPGFCSPLKPSSCNVTPRTAGQTRPAASAASQAGSSSSKTASPSDGLSLRTAARPPVPDAGPSHRSGGLAASASSASVATAHGAMFVSGGANSSLNTAQGAASSSGGSQPISGHDRQGRLIALRRVRLHSCLVLERFCMNSRRPASILGPYVPANMLFDMLQAACSRIGGCSFAVDDDVDCDDIAGNAMGSSARSSDSGEGRQPRGWLQQRLSPSRLQRFSCMQDRLNRSSTARRCVCGASAVRSGPAEDLCTCVDDILASCIWQLLRVHAMHVEDLQTMKVTAPCFPLKDSSRAGSATLARPWDRSALAWNVRLGLDAFLLRVQRLMVQVLLQLRSAQSATTAGPEVVASLQHRLAFLLRLCSAYLRHCCTRVLLVQMFQTVNPVLAAVKKYLCSAVDVVLPAPALRLWVAYLQLVGILIRNIHKAGAPCTAFGKVLLDSLLDFSLSIPDTGKNSGASGERGATPVPTPVVRSGASSPAPSRPGQSGQGQRTFSRSASLRSLQGGPPRLPGSAHDASPRTNVQGERSPSTTKAHSASRSEPCSVAEYLPRILERVLCDEKIDDALAAKPRSSAAGEDTAEVIRCRVLSFVESLLVFAQAIGASCHGVSCGSDAQTINQRKLQAAVAIAPGDVSGDTATERRSATMASQPCVVTLGVHEGFRTTMAAAAEPLVRGLLNWLQFLFLPPAGLLCRLARKLPLQGGTLAARLVLCERALFRVPMVSDSIYVCEAQVADYYVRRHFLNFVRLYNTRFDKGDGSARLEGNSKTEMVQINRLCCLHLQTLLAIASLQSEMELPRRAFHQLSVLDFLAGEVDLEHETTQMRDRFMRGAAQRQMSRASAASDNSSCTSSPANGPSRGGAVLGQPHAYQFPIVTPPLPMGVPSGVSEQSTEDLGTASPSVASHTSSAPGLRLSTSPAPATLALPSKKFVPKLQLRGLRPSLQGCSGLGAPPPEEPPSIGPQHLGTSASAPSFAAPPFKQPQQQSAATLPKVPAQAGSQTVPKLSFAGLAENPMHAPVNQQGDSGTESTAASAGVTPERMTFGTPQQHSGQTSTQELRSSSTEQDSGSTGAGACTGEAPRRPPPVVPTLPIGAHAPGAVTAGAEAAPVDTVDKSETICHAGGGSAEAATGAGALNQFASCNSGTAAAPEGSDQPKFTASPPVTPQTTSFSSTGGSGRPGSMESAQGRVATSQPAEKKPRPTEPEQAMAVAGTTSEADSSSEESSPTASSRRDQAALPAAGPGLTALPPLPSVAPPGPTQASTAPPRPATPLRPLGLSRSAVPQLSFQGLRPSLQGCSGLGCAPPEEPVGSMALGAVPWSQPQQVTGPAPASLVPQPAVNAGAQAQSAPLSPPPPSDLDSDSSSDAPPLKDENMPAKDAVADPGLLQAAASQIVDSSDASEAAEQEPGCPQAAAVQEEQAGYDSSDEEDEMENRAHQVAPGSAPGNSHNALSQAREQLDEDCNVSNSGSGRGKAPALPPMPDLRTSPPNTVGGCLMPLPVPGLPSRMPGARSGVPKLSFNGLRPSLQGCTGLGAMPPEEPRPEDHHPSAVTFAETMPMPLQINHLADGTEMAASTPTGSGYKSPTAGSSSSVPAGGEVDLSCMGVVHENIFYFEGRQRRKIYEDLELHSLMLTLILALLLTPKRGLLDPRYVDQYPFASHKRNVPFLLSLHLNHGANRIVLPSLSQQVETISHIGGFRLLKLLCETAMHRWMYTNWSRIAGGSFGTVYQCSVQFSEPGLVAVKQISKQASIQDRCVFTDVFSEIACLDAIRFEDHVCQLFDYGVDESGYWIVMKYYPTTLKKWREGLVGSMEDNLPALLCVYKQILKAVHTLHRHGVIHYDLKCDNIMLDPERALSGDPTGVGLEKASSCPKAPANSPRIDEGSPQAPVSQWPPPVKEEEPLLPGALPGLHGHRGMEIPCISVADFGESRMMSDADEVCVRNRGTELVKCPEMIELEKVGRKEGVNYDRRKRVGTNQAADVWSLGCLLFELLTSRFLFQDDDYGVFWARVTGSMAVDIISEANCRLLEGNLPLLEYIRYVLVRDKNARPSISAAIKKFECTAAEALRFSSRHNWHGEDMQMVERRVSADTCDSPRSVARSIGGSSGGGPHSRSDYSRPDRPLICAAAGEAGSHFTKVFHDLSVLEVSEEDLQRLASGMDVGIDHANDAALLGRGGCARGTLKALLAQHLWTHIVDFRVAGTQRLPFQEEVHYFLEMPWPSSSTSAEDFLSFLPTLFDFLRHAAITRGVVLLVDGSSVEEHRSTVVGDSSSGTPAKAPEAASTRIVEPSATGGNGASSAGRGGLAMAAVLALVTEIYGMAVFPALSHLSSQLLVAAVRPDVVGAMACWQESERRAALRRREGTIRIACFCGSCSWHIPAKWLSEARAAPQTTHEPSTAWPGPHARLVSCSCNAKSSSASRCPSHGNCESYVRWLRARFGVTSQTVRWLWLPEGVDAYSYSDGTSSGVLTRGLKAQAEPVAEPGRRQDDPMGRYQRFRCSSCQVLTHAEIHKVPGQAGDPRTEPSEPPRVALVCSYEVLRCAMSADAEGAHLEVSTAGSGTHASVASSSALVGRPSRRPPVRLRDVHLEEVMLPPAQPHAKHLL